MNAATTKTKATRKKSPASKPRDAADAAYLKSLSPWVRKLELLARPLRGKLTKAINQK